MRDAVNQSPLAARVTVNWITVGENVGAEVGVVEIQRAFEASPGHLAALVDPRFNCVGVGVGGHVEDRLPGSSSAAWSAAAWSRVA